MVTKHTFFTIIILGASLLAPCAQSMHSQKRTPSPAQASCSYTPEETSSDDSCLWATPDTIDAYMLQLEEYVQQAQQSLDPQVSRDLEDFYANTTFTQPFYKKNAIETIAPLIDTLIERNDDLTLSHIAFIFVGTQHAPRVNRAVQDIMAARHAATYTSNVTPIMHPEQEQPAYRPTTRILYDADMPTAAELHAIEQDLAPQAPPYEQLDQDIASLIEHAVKTRDVAHLMLIAETHPEYAALVNDALAPLMDAPETPQTEGQLNTLPAATPSTPEAPINHEHPSLGSYSRIATATLIGGISLYTLYRSIKKSH